MRRAAKQLRPTLLALLTAGSLLPAPSWAQAGAVPAATTELGTLIYTDAERRELEQARGHARTATGQTAGESAAPSVSTVTLGGFVRRSDGLHTAWVNGASTPVGSQARHRGDFVVVRDAAGRLRSLKPGQSIASDETVVREPFEDAAALARGRAGNAKPVRLMETTTETRLETITSQTKVKSGKVKQIRGAKRGSAAKATKKPKTRTALGTRVVAPKA